MKTIEKLSLSHNAFVHTTPRPLRWLWMALAYLALGIGLVGIVVPGLPTVPFVLLASFFASRGSQRLHTWLHTHQWFGPMLHNWEEHGAVSLHAKRMAVSMMTLCSLLMFWVAPMRAWVIGSGVMCVVGIWLWRRPEPPR